jgi:uncharacterized protein (TIGR03032 family)
MSVESPAAESLQSVHTTTLGELLRQGAFSFLVSTYQAGKVFVVRARGDELNTHFRNFDTPMGLAHTAGRLAIGTKVAVGEFHNQPQVAKQLEPTGQHDACFLPRHSIVTGQIAVHDIAWAGRELWVVNTRFSALSTLDQNYSFVPRWRPKFISALAPEDRCHLNGLAMRDGRPRYVTALGEADSPAGWRKNKASGGILMDVESGEIICRGLSMPHSPRWHEGKLWVLESGKGSIGVVDLANSRIETLATVPGFTRGLDFFGPYAFVGLSQVRESALSSGIPLAQRIPLEQRACGVWVIDTRNGETVAFLRFQSGVREIFAVQVLPAMRWPEILTEESPIVAESFLLPDEAMGDVPSA